MDSNRISILIMVKTTTYTYDRNGNQVTKQTISGLTSYRFEVLDRLALVEYPDRLESFCGHGSNRGNTEGTFPDPNAPTSKRVRGLAD